MISSAPPKLRPSQLAEVLLQHSHWETPAAILDGVFKPHAQVAVKACHASSKSFTAADAVLLTLLAGGDAITTAPTWTQVETVLWGAIHRAIAQSRVSDWGQVNLTEIKMSNGQMALGISTNEGVRFQGFHARENAPLLVVLDEAPGVLPSIYEAVEGIAAGGDVRKLYIGNPVISSGPFYDIFAGSMPGWQRFTIDAFDSPNLRGLGLEQLLTLSDDELDVAERPYLVTRRWVRDRYYEWGPEHPSWESRVRGRFPLQAEDALISLGWLEEAKNREATPVEALPIVAGVDVAGPGDAETVLTVRQGDVVLSMQAWAQPDPRGAVIAALAPYKRPGREVTVNVDVAGIGHYFALALRDAGFSVNPINVGESPTDNRAADQFANLKAQVYWQFRDRVQAGNLAGLTDQIAISQLAGIRYQHDRRGHIAIESKDDARKRGVKSPDRAESVVLAFWENPQGAWAKAIGSSAQLSYGEPVAPNPFGAAREEMDRDRQEQRRQQRRLERRAY